MARFWGHRSRIWCRHFKSNIILNDDHMENVDLIRSFLEVFQPNSYWIDTFLYQLRKWLNKVEIVHSIMIQYDNSLEMAASKSVVVIQKRAALMWTWCGPWLEDRVLQPRHNISFYWKGVTCYKSQLYLFLDDSIIWD